jgi:succinoglycan biosynthesis protein ExoA
VEPRVSVVIPALNEAAYIERCVRSVVEQEAPGGLEVIVVDGSSSDGTAELARAAGAVVLENPQRAIPSALNRGLEAASGEVVVRFDAHAEMPPGYVVACLRALDEEGGAASVGGWREARGQGPWGRALGSALASPLGVGHSLIWRRPANGDGRRDVEHVPLGCFHMQALEGVGGWREDLFANEDFELDYRLRAKGGRIVFDPSIWSVYRPRESLQAIAGQYWRYGRSKAIVLRETPRSLQPRQLAPPALLAAAALAVVPNPAATLARLLLGSYGLALAGTAARSSAGWRTAPVLATMHLAWGAGVVFGLASRRRRYGADSAQRKDSRQST